AGVEVEAGGERAHVPGQPGHDGAGEFDGDGAVPVDDGGGGSRGGEAPRLEAGGLAVQAGGPTEDVVEGHHGVARGEGGGHHQEEAEDQAAGGRGCRRGEGGHFTSGCTSQL